MSRPRIPCWERFEEVAAHYEYDEGKTREVAEHLSAKRQGYTSAKTIKAAMRVEPGPVCLCDKCEGWGGSGRSG